MTHGLALKPTSSNKLRVGDTIYIHKSIINKYSLTDISYMVIGVNLELEPFPCASIISSGTLFFYSGYETV